MRRFTLLLGCLSLSLVACNSLLGVEELAETSGSSGQSGTAGSAGASAGSAGQAGAAGSGGSGQSGAGQSGSAGASGQAGSAGQAGAGAGGGAGEAGAGQSGAAGLSGGGGEAGAGGAGAGGESGSSGQAGEAGAGGVGGEAGQGGAGAAGDGGSAGDAGAGGEAGAAGSDGGQAGESGASGQGGTGEAGTAGAAGAGQAGAGGDGGAGGAGGDAGQGGAGGGQAGMSGSSGQGGAGAGGAGGATCPPSTTDACEAPTAHLVTWWHADGRSTMGSVEHLDTTGRLKAQSLGVSPQFVDGKQGKAWFLKSGRALEVPYQPSLIPTKAFTIEGWLNPHSTGPILAKNTPGEGDGLLLDVGNAAGGKFHLRFIVGSKTLYTDTEHSLEPDVMVHFAVTFDGQNMRIYVDGQVAIDAACANSLPVPSELPDLQFKSFPQEKPLRIGADFAASPNYLDAELDELKIYDVALTPSQVKAARDGTGCVVRDPLRWDFAGPPGAGTAPVQAYYSEPGFTGQATNTNSSYDNGDGIPFQTYFSNGTDSFPYIKLTLTEPYNIDQLSFVSWSNPQVSYNTLVEISPKGETNPKATNFTKLGQHANSGLPSRKGPFKVDGTLAPGSYLIRLRPESAPQPATTWTALSAFNVIGHSP